MRSDQGLWLEGTILWVAGGTVRTVPTRRPAGRLAGLPARLAQRSTYG
jgi:hypothetical protein